MCWIVDSCVWVRMVLGLDDWGCGILCVLEGWVGVGFVVFCAVTNLCSEGERVLIV